MGSRPLDEGLCAGLGQNWIASHNTFKPYPCGFLLHPTLDACLTIADAPIFAIEDIEQITVTVHPLSKLRADRIHPVDGLEAKLSLQHAVAITLLWGEAGVRTFTDDAANDLVVRACREKIRLIADERLNTDEARVVIHLQSGRVISHEISEAQPPMSQKALERKFRELVAFGSPHCNSDELLETLATFPQMANAADLMAMTVSQS
jgi:2-methylcitrate dehydratase PrpD